MKWFLLLHSFFLIVPTPLSWSEELVHFCGPKGMVRVHQRPYVRHDRYSIRIAVLLYIIKISRN